MYTPMSPKTERPRIRTEREYREWQMSLRGTMPVRRFKDTPSLPTRVMNTIRRVAGQRPQLVAEPRQVKQEPC